MQLFRVVLFQYRKYKKAIKNKRIQNLQQSTLKKYFQKGQIPWSDGYQLYKEKSIVESINSTDILQRFNHDETLESFGYRLDERIVEYPWIFKNLQNKSAKLLDAGSTFNYEFILDHPLIKEKELIIFTYAPESRSYNEKKISYVYGDLRELPFKDQYFEVIVSQSTIEHIDMNNSIYGYQNDDDRKSDLKSYKYLLAIKEMIRVLKPSGTLLLTFPFGKFENHDFFQQLDREMLQRLLNEFHLKGSYVTNFFRYLPSGWYSCDESDCNEIVSFNPHTNKGKGDDGAAHCRSICCIKFTKNL
jgi:SAM-dependent methyltransferase